MKKEKKFTKAEVDQLLAKAIDESYTLGFKEGRANIKPGIQALATELSIVTLQKNIEDNNKKINKSLMDTQVKAVKNHMQAWSRDAEKALEEILAASDLHHNHDH